jgi:hypothetical protein
MRPFSQDFTSSPQRLKGSAGAGQTRRVTSRVTLDCLSEAGACRPKGGGPLGEVGSVAKDAAGLLSGAAYGTVRLLLLRLPGNNGAPRPCADRLRRRSCL